MILGFPFGLLLALGLYHAVIIRMRLPEILQYGLGALFGVVMAFGYAVSVQVRCISWLMIPTFFGRSGRAYLGAMAIMFLITGPIGNMIGNAEEVTRVISCSSQMAQNMSKARMELRFKPIHDIMKDLTRQGKKIDKITSDARKAFMPAQVEVRDDSVMEELKGDINEADHHTGEQSRVQKIEKKYANLGNTEAEQEEKKLQRKMDYQCEDVFSMAVKGCRNSFKEAHQKCMGKLKFAGHLLCLPLKLTILCKLVKLVQNAAGINCNAMDAVNPGFGESFATANSAADAMGKNFDVNMQYKMESVEEDLDRRTAEDVSLAVNHEFKMREMWINFVKDVVKRLMAFLFLKVIFSAYSYQAKYVTNFQYDNIYITDYYRRIDARRYIQSKHTLLPLKKLESQELVKPTHLKLMGPEKKKLGSGTIRLLLRLFSFVMVIIVDYIINEILIIIRDNSQVTYKQQGEHHIALQVHGTSVLGNLFRSILGGFNKKHSINNVRDNKECLPHPVPRDNDFIWHIGLIFLASWLLIILEAYGLRLRRLVCASFYPKREKKRILLLYNEMLKRRKGFQKHAKHQAKRKAKEKRLSRQIGLMVSLRHQFPRLCCCLKLLGIGKKTCLICDEPEGKDFHICTTPGCNFGYCEQCWFDIKKKCYACMRDDDWDTDTDFTDLDL